MKYSYLLLTALIVVGVTKATPALAANSCSRSLTPEDINPADYPTKDPKAAKKLVDDLISNGILLGKIHEYVLNTALANERLVPFDIARTNLINKSVGDRKLENKAYKSAETTLANTQIQDPIHTQLAESAVQELTSIFGYRDFFTQPGQRLSFAQEKAGTIGISLKDYYKAQDLMWSLHYEQRPFLRKLFIDSDLAVVRILYAKTSSPTDEWSRWAARIALPLLMGVLPMHWGYALGDVPTVVLPFGTAGVEFLASIEDDYRRGKASHRFVERFTALPLNLIRRVLGKRRLRSYIQLYLKQDPSMDLLEGKSEDARFQLLEIAVDKESQSFDRESLRSLRPQLELSSLEKSNNFGKTLPNMAGELADRFTAISEEKSKNVASLQKLTAAVVSSKADVKMSDLRNALTDRLSSLGTLQNENEQLTADLILLKDQVQGHLHELVLNQDLILAASPNVQKELSSIASELEVTYSMVNALAEQSQNIGNQILEERALIRQVRAAGTAKTIVAGKLSESLDATESIEKLADLYKKDFANGGLYGN